MTSVHLRAQLGLGILPAGNDLPDVLMSIGMVHLEIAKDGDDADHFAIELIAEVDRWRRCAGDTIGTVEGHA